MAEKNLYEILGVSKDASQDDIKKQYRRLARKYHPDVNPGDTSAEARFKEISSAFEVLSDPEKRKMYDEFGEDAAKLGYDPEKAEEYRRWKRAQQQGARGFGFGAGGGGGGVEFDLGDLGDIFGGAGFDPRDIFGGFRGGRMRRRGGDVQTHLTVSFKDAVLGTEREIALERPATASEPARTQRLKVQVPPGIESGQRIRLAGQGEPGVGGGPAGDLYISVDVREHRLLRREGRDLHLDVPVTISEAMFGARIDVPTLTGKVKLTVPRGSQSGRTLRLRGKGVPATKTASAGDMYVHLMVRVPQPDSDAAAAERAAQELERLYAGNVRAGLEL